MGLAQIICSAKVSKLVEEGRQLEKVLKIIFFAVIVHSERHYYINEIWFVPSCRYYDCIEQE